ncbi:salutaridine reductase-like [Durio zibethinus]|uniref:Salutaridine reductase-like n=1 Tax=Durio zibethinus TaxID=66656 RepID=A0A6P5XLG9_DURZI|nr:salutaridine reductase-like [Durio zibethinus]
MQLFGKAAKMVQVLQLFPSGAIVVNISSLGEINFHSTKRIPSECIRIKLSDVANLTKGNCMPLLLYPIEAQHLSGEVAKMVQSVIKYTYEEAQVCLNTNYYGVQRVTETLLPLLQLSSSGARIVNVSSLRSELKLQILRRIPSESIRNELGDIENLTEEKLNGILKRFLMDFIVNTLEANGWSIMLPAYSISKAVLNAYTRILARKYPNMRINCVHPGYVNTDLNWHTGIITTEEGAKGPIKCALIPDGGPTGCYFDQTQVAEF